MRRTGWLLGGVLLAVAALGSDSPEEYDGRIQVLNPLRGRWRPLKVEVAYTRGGKIICTGDATAEIVFEDNRYLWGWGDQYSRLESSRGVCTVDPSKGPGHLDLTDKTGPLAGTTRRCIYRIDGDTLQIASRTEHPDLRPESFEGPLTIYTLKREKK
jgi:uncharacterized protein (TIGR03067 family)